MYQYTCVSRAVPLYHRTRVSQPYHLYQLYHLYQSVPVVLSSTFRLAAQFYRKYELMLVPGQLPNIT